MLLQDELWNKPEQHIAYLKVLKIHETFQSELQGLELMKSSNKSCTSLHFKILHDLNLTNMVHSDYK